DAQAKLCSRFDSRKAVGGHFQGEELAVLFHQHYAQIGSAAVIPLRYNDTLGMLAIDSDDVDYFDSSMGSLFLSYISDSLSRLLPPLLAQERQDEPNVALATR